MTATAPRYMTRFRCLAEACEDTCCAGLVVLVSEPRLQRLKQAVAGTPDAERVESFVRKEPDASPGDDAVIAKREDGHCVFLDARKTCSLHRAYGEAALPDACATFPRVATRWAHGLEVTGSLACPEVARLCLLAEDGVDPVPVAEDLALRPENARALSGAGEDAWPRHAEAVRATALSVLQRRELPFAARLFALGQLGLRLDGFYFQGTEVFRGDAREGAEALLAEVLRAFSQQETLTSLHEGFAALSLPGGPWVGICAAALKSRLGAVRSERFHTLVELVLESYGGADLLPDDAWRRYAERRALLSPGLAQRVEQYLRHHAVNHWLRHPFTDAPHVLDYVFRMALREAVLCWTLFGHPTVVALCTEGAADTAESRARLDAAAVECFQLIAKHVEQAPQLHALAQGLAGSGGGETLGRMLVLLTGL
ncbi:flagellin lysine-N-methylase [Corallococcus macrosporus]|uniref:Flagellar protein FliB n=1 Tax=Corallococcus macrosporus DSM 14697 TaxID=1189310 RepID=A0A250K4F9_9BACT|nr:flagellin lysine-N-methylase [Corallococcus macrosporus]ATB50637.1 flagellar protein FliB [Corallococcus macrosporus DSM 14697]